MNLHKQFATLIVLSIISIIVLPGCTNNKRRNSESDAPTETQPTKTAKAASVLPPLEIDMDEPLLLEETNTQKEKAKADNSTCLVCHGNFDEEPLAANHAANNVGCAACHGKSFAHKNDENNTTPPDRMFPIDSIDGFCSNCHKSHNIPARYVIAMYRKKNLKKSDPLACTTCHGRHRMKVRTVIWDKNTGELLPQK